MQVGAQKPDARLFHHALAGVGTEPSRTLMVGDRPETDGGAARIGMPVLLVPPNADWLPVVADLLGAS